MARKPNSSNIAVRCPECFTLADDKAAFIHHLTEYRYQHSKYSLAAAIRMHKTALDKAQAEQTQDALYALGYEKCRACDNLSDPSTWKPAILTKDRNTPVCIDCQPLKVIDGVGAIYKSKYNLGEFDYCLMHSEYAAGSYESMEIVERHLRAHVAQMTDNVDLIFNEEDRKDWHRQQRWYRRMKEIMGAGHCDNDARQIESGFMTCKEHEVCAYQPN